MLQEQQGMDEIWKESSRYSPNCRICRLFCLSWYSSWILSALMMMLPLPSIVFPLQKSNLSLGQDSWIFQDSNKASKSDCEKLQHTKLFSRDQISSQVSSTSHNPSLFVTPPFMPCSLWPVDKTDEPWSSFNRQNGKKVREDCSHWPWQHFQVPE